MNKTMKAARIFGANDMRLVTVPVPELGPHDILCKVKRAGICGTDHSIYSGEFSFVKNGAIKFPMTPGHEWSGVVAAVGSAVGEFRLGDRVVGDTCVSCGTCVNCLLGGYQNCEKIRCVGTINTWDGAYAEYIVMPDRHLFHLPDSVSFDAAALVEPAATSLKAIKCAGVQIGETVLVHGSGPLGLLAAKLAKLSGAAKVFVTGRKEAKLKVALAFGADVAINTTRESFADVIARHTPGGKVDRVIETSGATELLLQSLNLIRVGGALAAVAFYDKLIDGLDIDKLVFGNITFQGTSGSTGMYQPVIALMATGALDVEPLISGRYPFSALPQKFTELKSQDATRIKWLIEFD